MGKSPFKLIRYLYQSTFSQETLTGSVPAGTALAQANQAEPSRGRIPAAL
jgi:hypothetical protein